MNENKYHSVSMYLYFTRKYKKSLIKNLLHEKCFKSNFKISNKKTFNKILQALCSVAFSLYTYNANSRACALYAFVLIIDSVGGLCFPLGCPVRPLRKG
jgi:hypothetical protein